MNGIFMGVDPGIADAGFGVVQVQGGKISPLHFGSIKTPAGMPSDKRLFILSKELAALFAKFQPKAVGVEKLYFSKNVTTAILVAEARGVIRLTIAAAGITCLEMNPADVKIAVCGHGTAPKPQIQKMVTMLLGLQSPPKPDDAADGLALAIATSQMARLAAIPRR